MANTARLVTRLGLRKAYQENKTGTRHVVRSVQGISTYIGAKSHRQLSKAYPKNRKKVADRLRAIRNRPEGKKTLRRLISGKQQANSRSPGTF